MTFKDGEDYYVNNVLLLDPKNIPYTPSFEVKLKTCKMPKGVKLLPDEANVDFEFDGSFVTFKTHETKIFSMYKIEC